MKESFKKNWKPITAMACCFAVVGVAAYYVNCIYLPDRQQAEAAKLTATQQITPKEYNYTVNTSNSQTASSSTNPSGTSSTNPANDRINVTTEANGDVTIKRTWDVKPDELDTSTTSPESTVSANIGSGGEKITGADGAYHGEQPADPAPSKPAESKPTTPAAPAEKPSTPSNPSSSTPKDGDTRVVSGQKQEYWEGFGWVDDNSDQKGDNGGFPDYIGDPDDELSGIQVGEMG